MRAILLASEMAATLVGRRANNAASHGQCFAPWSFAQRITARAPAVNKLRRYRSPCLLMLPSLSLDDDCASWMRGAGGSLATLSCRFLGKFTSNYFGSSFVRAQLARVLGSALTASDWGRGCAVSVFGGVSNRRNC